MRHRSARPLVRSSSFAAHAAVAAPAPDLFTALLPPAQAPAPAGPAQAAEAAAATATAAPQSPEDLHPALWRAHQLARPREAVLASDYPELDAQLPGGGWPVGALTELLLPHPGVGELRLLAPVLAAVQALQRCVMWFDPPATPCAWALLALGIDVRRLVLVTHQAGVPGQVPVPAAGRGRGVGRPPAADMLWALEQALKSGHLGAVLAWLPPRLPADALRRLQLAAQAHEGPVFLLRSEQERARASAAPLRLLLGCAGPDQLQVALLKRRGPPLATPLTLALAPVLSPPALARAQQGAAALPLQAGTAVPARAQSGFATGP